MLGGRSGLLDLEELRAGASVLMLERCDVVCEVWLQASWLFSTPGLGARLGQAPWAVQAHWQVRPNRPREVVVAGPGAPVLLVGWVRCTCQAMQRGARSLMRDASHA